MTSLFSRAARVPLAVMDRIGNAEMTKRLGLRTPFLQVIETGATLAVRVAGKLAAPVRLPRPEQPRTGFDLTPTDEQAMMRDTARKFADVLRAAAAAADAGSAAPADVLARGHALSLASLSIPAEHGGLAETRSPLSSVLVAEEFARGDLSLALALLAPLGVVNALVDWGTAQQQERWLPRFIGDAFVPAAIALLEPHPAFDAMQPRTGAVRCDGGWKLHGEKVLVPLAANAELLLVAATILGRGRAAVRRRARCSGCRGDRATGDGPACRGDGARRPPRRALAEDALVGDDGYDHGALVDGGRLVWSALAVGAAQAVLDYVILRQRARRIRRAVSHRQSCAFMIANIAIEVEGMRLATWRAAALAERDVPFARGRRSPSGSARRAACRSATTACSSSVVMAS